MHIGRRELVVGAATAVAAFATGKTAARPAAAEHSSMYGLIGKATALPGRRDELIAILLEGTARMPGCQSYVVAKDTADENAIWITEVWDSKESHDASLSLPEVQAAIAKGRPLFAGFDAPVTTIPVGGYGLPAPGGR